MASDINDLAIGQMVIFQSLLPSDNNSYHGKVLSMMTWEEAIKHGDIIAYNTNLNNALGLTNNYKELTYFLIQQYSYADNLPQEKLIFAKEWVDTATFTITANFKTLTYMIYGVPEDQIVALTNSIKALGYVTVLTKTE